VRQQTGVALVTVVLLLGVLGVLSAALVLGAITDTLVARNLRSASEVRAAADAGVSHALALVMPALNRWQESGFVSPGAAMSALLAGPDGSPGPGAAAADNGSLEALGIPRPPARLALGSPGIEYEVQLVDDDDPQRGLALDSSEVARIGENGLDSVDANTRIAVRATGYGPAGARAFAEATLGPAPAPALVTAGALTLGDAVTVTGSHGSVHVNGDLVVAGGVSVAGDVTATGQLAVAAPVAIGGRAEGGVPSVAIPETLPLVYRHTADVVLGAEGLMRSAAGSVLCDASLVPDACPGWLFSAPGWVQQGAVAGGVYYVEGNLDLAGVLGSVAAPVALTALADGSILVTGSLTLQPALPRVLLVAGGDLVVSGNLVADREEALVAARGGVLIDGTARMAGQVVAEGAQGVGSLAAGSAVTGSLALRYTGLVGHAGDRGVVVAGWRWEP